MLTVFNINRQKHVEGITIPTQMLAARGPQATGALFLICQVLNPAGSKIRQEAS